MKNQWLKIPLVYSILTAIYYPSALIIDKLDDRTDSRFASFHSELSDIFFWANTHLIYVFSLMGSSLIGLLWFYNKAHSPYIKGFGIVFLIGTLLFLIMILVATFS